MRYLFFDIECCDGRNICSFGYVIIDEGFEVLEKRDILINPETKFKLGKSGKKPDIELAYDEETFFKNTSFFAHYEEIKELLYRPDQAILGHSVAADINFLKTACNRYKCEKLKFFAYDTQNFYYQLNKKYRVRSLENIVADLNIDISELRQHKSEDDAHISMLVTKEICNRLEVSLSELTELCEGSKIDSRKINDDNAMYRLVCSSDIAGAEAAGKDSAMALAMRKAMEKKSESV